MAELEVARSGARLMEAVEPTLDLHQRTDMAAYLRPLLNRLCSPMFWHLTPQLALDDLLMLPQRILGTIADRLAAGMPVDAHALVVAAWMR